jgi:hypothetical protein
MRPLRHLVLAAAALATLVASPVAAQRTPPRPAGAAADATTRTAAPRWDLFGSYRVRGEAWDWFDLSDLGQYAYAGATARVGAVREAGEQAWRLELAAPLLVGLPAGAAGPLPTVPAGTFGPGASPLGLGGSYRAANFDKAVAVQLFPKQAYWQLRRRELRRTRTLRVGRFEYDDGVETEPASATLGSLKRGRVAARLLGTFGWTHVGRSLDGVHWSSKKDGGDRTLLLAAPTRGVFQVDGWAPLPVAVAYGAWTVPYTTGRGSSDARLFGLQYVDLRDGSVPLVSNGPAQTLDGARLAVTTVGGHWIHALESNGATFDALLWGAGQLGSWGAQSHRAWSGVAEAGVQPRGLPRLNPWVRVGIMYGSGDGDPDDDRHGTFFQVLPTPRPYARLPFYNMQNIHDTYASLALRPSQRLTIQGEFHALRLAERRDLWYSGGGAWQPRTFGYQGRSTGNAKELAHLVDLSVDMRLTPDHVISGYLGRATSGDAMRSAYPRQGLGTLFYLEMRQAF